MVSKEVEHEHVHDKKKPNCQNCSKFFTTIRLPLVTAKGCSCNCNIFLLEPSSPEPCTCKVHATIILSASVDSRSWFTNLCITKHLQSKMKSFETNTGKKKTHQFDQISEIPYKTENQITTVQYMTEETDLKIK